MNTPAISVVLFLVASLFGALGQYLYKSGAEAVKGGFVQYLTNWRILSGVMCYILVMLLFVVAYKKGGAMSVLYPIYATTFVWGALIAMIVYGEPIKLINIGGMAFLFLGMYMMGK